MLYTYDLTPALRTAIQDAGARRRVWDHLHAVASLQGIVNRHGPRLYVYAVGEKGRTDRYWLNLLQQPDEWLHDETLHPLPDIAALIRVFRQKIRGAVLWDERVPATANIASTAAGVEDLIVLRYDPSPQSLCYQLTRAPGGPRIPVLLPLLANNNQPLFTGNGKIPGTTLSSTGSAKCDAYLWAAEKYLRTKRCRPTRMGYYPDAYFLTRDLKIPAERSLLVNHDYFIAQRGFFFDLSPWTDEAPDDARHQPPNADGETLLRLLRYAYDAAGGSMIHVGGFVPWDQKYTRFTGGKHGEVETEWRYAEILSCFNAYMDADAAGLHAMANASLFQHYPLKKRYPQTNLPTINTLRVKKYLTASGGVVNKTFVTFYVGDYDSAAWLYQRLPDIWNDPARGQVPLGWAFNPTLQHRFPVGLAITRKTATKNDTFITGDSGVGYLNPGYLTLPRRWSRLPSGLKTWEKYSRPYYNRWDLRITGFIIDGNAPPMNDDTKRMYARLSPGGVVAQKIPPRSLVGGVPFLQMGPDITGAPEDGAARVTGHAPKSSGGPEFVIYRTILWAPSAHQEMFAKIRALRPDIEIVEPHTLFLLLQQHLSESAK